MAGILRIEITDLFYNDRRTRNCKIGKPIANKLYPKVLDELSMPLEPDVGIINCSKKEAMGRYDWREGIDVILRCRNGSKFTLQEKFLTYSRWPPTVTMELNKASGKQGAWYTCTAQWYFVSYFTKDEVGFAKWILVNLPGLREGHAQKRIKSFDQQPKDPRRGGPFRCWEFKDLPEEIIVAGCFPNFRRALISHPPLIDIKALVAEGKSAEEIATIVSKPLPIVRLIISLPKT